ncbi:MAG: DUF2949 domain-containing protein [Prochlorococcus marinus CUG1438]|nr:DUF2949 domain-containing protein [Prochlorococcus marinus CUG1438]
MKNNLSKNIIIYLVNEIGLDESSIELGLKLSIRNNTPLPILLWSYGMLTIEELDKLYSFLFQKMDL